jgi:hypothetical protein
MNEQKLQGRLGNRDNFRKMVQDQIIKNVDGFHGY